MRLNPTLPTACAACLAAIVLTIATRLDASSARVMARAEAPPPAESMPQPPAVPSECALSR